MPIYIGRLAFRYPITFHLDPIKPGDAMTEKTDKKPFSTLKRPLNRDAHIKNNPETFHFRETLKASMPEWREAQIKKASQALARKKNYRHRVIRHPLLLGDLW